MFGKLALALRLVVSLLAAAAVLYAFSYPDSIIPRSLAETALEDREISIYSARPLLFIVPLVLMEIVSLCGPRKNLVWFTGLFGVLLATIAAWPVLTALRPELVYPTFEFEDGKLAGGLLPYCILIACSLVLRSILLAYLFTFYRSVDDDTSGDVDAAELNPEKALTVREIAALPRKPKYRFLFSEIDFHSIRSFHELMNSLLLRRRTLRIALGAGAVLLAAWFFLFPQPDEEQALQRDLQAMYATAPARGSFIPATPRALHAAYRVMDYISRHESFAGFTQEQAEEWLHLDRAPEAYRAQLRDERDISLPSVDDAFESRTRFLTVTDGTRISVLYIRKDATEKHINVAEVQDAGWNAIADEERRELGSEWRGAYFRK